MTVVSQAPFPSVGCRCAGSPHSLTWGAGRFWGGPRTQVGVALGPIALLGSFGVSPQSPSAVQGAGLPKIYGCRRLGPARR